MKPLSILYRGPLSSCNYACEYCPFAKRVESYEQLQYDRECLVRFLEWVQQHDDWTLSIFFTPWGEALVRRWYQDAIATLTKLQNLAKVAIQTNLSCKLDWLDRCDTQKLGLWCTYHPGEVARERFVAKCRELHSRGVRFSVGVVGLNEHVTEITRLRDDLPPEVYVWINAYKRVPNYYTLDTLSEFQTIDPLFGWNNQYHASYGEACDTGESVISVEGDGTVRRCHFVAEPIGNLYAGDFPAMLKPRTCPNQTCGCHIGYVHLQTLGLRDTFADGILERIPRMLRESNDIPASVALQTLGVSVSSSQSSVQNS